MESVWEMGSGGGGGGGSEDVAKCNGYKCGWVQFADIRYLEMYPWEAKHLHETSNLGNIALCKQNRNSIM